MTDNRNEAITTAHGVEIKGIDCQAIDGHY